MLDQLRRDIQTRLDELLGEVDKLRRALAALSSRHTSTTSQSATTPRARATPASSPETRKPARPPQTAATPRAAPGATKAAVLTALADGNAMTAAQIAAATGLGRATVSTTLSRLAKTGEVTKAARGYQIAGQTS